MIKNVDIPLAVLLRGIEGALREMGAGLTDQQTVTGALGVTITGENVMLTAVKATICPKQAQQGIRLAAVNGDRVA